MMISSKQNSSFKLWVKLKQKKYRDTSGMFLVYGKHLIEKAKEHDAIVDILTSSLEKEGLTLTKELMDELQQAETYFDQIAVCKKTNPVIVSSKILMLDDVQDPDNVGALIRSASAFGFNHVILSLKSADLYNEKVIRASKGSIFDVYYERMPLDKALINLNEKGFQLIYADAHNQGTPKKSDKIVLVLGNEGHGVSEQVQKLCHHPISIMTNHVESLNVSVAGGILMYEWRTI